MSRTKLTLAVLLAALALSACGVKGDPVRPVAKPEAEKPAQTSN